MNKFAAICLGSGLCAAASLAPAPALALVLVDNIDTTDNSGGASGAILANPFRTTSNAFIVTDVAITLDVFGGAGTYNFDVGIFNSNGTSPTTQATPIVSRSLVASSSGVFVFEETGLSISLQPDTLYFLAVRPTTGSSFGWLTDNTVNPPTVAPPGGGRWRTTDGVTWTQSTFDPNLYNQYRIEAAPAPSPAAGLLPLSFALRSIRKRYRSLQEDTPKPVST